MPPCTPTPLIPTLLHPPAHLLRPPLLQPSIPLLLHQACAPVLLRPCTAAPVCPAAPSALCTPNPVPLHSCLLQPCSCLTYRKKQRIPNKISIISACWRKFLFYFHFILFCYLDIYIEKN
ncbi:hypothetical protein SLEP1_g15316 [Rubroshorea leprosula]|uniref:Uncharacterized protein n=1 Tax=Rubroshorea leprosula TaxID=152421 RepID=A0AAV5ILZ1_9ROSI|nr:hypothetical protein SLEP1_g15316 [Rubroshorea leprosula]